MRGNYQCKLSPEIMSENYQLVYYHAKNVRFIAYVQLQYMFNKNMLC